MSHGTVSNKMTEAAGALQATLGKITGNSETIMKGEEKKAAAQFANGQTPTASTTAAAGSGAGYSQGANVAGQPSGQAYGQHGLQGAGRAPNMDNRVEGATSQYINSNDAGLAHPHGASGPMAQEGRSAAGTQGVVGSHGLGSNTAPGVHNNNYDNTRMGQTEGVSGTHGIHNANYDNTRMGQTEGVAGTHGIHNTHGAQNVAGGAYMSGASGAHNPPAYGVSNPANDMANPAATGSATHPNAGLPGVHPDQAGASHPADHGKLHGTGQKILGSAKETMGTALHAPKLANEGAAQRREGEYATSSHPVDPALNMTGKHHNRRASVGRNDLTDIGNNHQINPPHEKVVSERRRGSLHRTEGFSDLSPQTSAASNRPIGTGAGMPAEHSSFRTQSGLPRNQHAMSSTNAADSHRTPGGHHNLSDKHHTGDHRDVRSTQSGVTGNHQNLAGTETGMAGRNHNIAGTDSGLTGHQNVTGQHQGLTGAHNTGFENQQRGVTGESRLPGTEQPGMTRSDSYNMRSGTGYDQANTGRTSHGAHREIY